MTLYPTCLALLIFYVSFWPQKAKSTIKANIWDEAGQGFRKGFQIRRIEERGGHSKYSRGHSNAFKSNQMIEGRNMCPRCPQSNFLFRRTYFGRTLYPLPPEILSSSKAVEIWKEFLYLETK